MTAVNRQRPHLWIAGVAVSLLLATVLLRISVPGVALGLVVLAMALGTVIRPEVGLHVLVVNALVGLTRLVEMPRLGPFSAPILFEGLVLGAILFQAAFLGRRVPLGSRQHLLFGLLGVTILTSILMGVSVGPENFRLYRNLFLVRLVMFVLVTGIMTTARHLRRLIVTVMIANVGLLGAALLVRLGYFGVEAITISQDFERTGALVQNPNELAFTLTTMLVLAIVGVLYIKGPIARFALLGLAAADIIAILSTLSRSGFISLCVVMIFLFVKLTRNVRAVGVLLVLVLIGLMVAPDALFARFSKIDQVEDVDRFQIMQVGLSMAMAHPLLGVGLGNYVDVFWDYNVSNMRRAAPAHNMYLDLAAQMGLPSLLLYLAILMITWRGLRRMESDLSRSGGTRGFDYLLNVAIQAFLVNLAVFGLSGDVEFDYTVVIMIGAAVTLLRDHERRLETVEGTVGASGRN